LTSDPIAIACVADDSYALPLAVTLVSATTALAPDCPLAIYIVDAGIDERNKQRILASLDSTRVSVTWIPHAGSRLAGLPVWGRMSLHTYERVLVAELLPAGLSKIIWLDSDLIVKADLMALWRIDLSDCALLAARDTLVPFVSSSLGIRQYRALGFDGTEKYFNAGVMVIDLDRWRRDGIANKAIVYLNQHRRDVILWDQDALNVVLRGQWGELDPRWNHNAGVCGRPLVAEPWIVHFSGVLKPWIFRSDRPSCTDFFRYVDATAWAGWRPRKTWANTLLARYGASTWRNLIYPGEEWGFRLWRALTFRPGHNRDEGASERLSS